MAPIVYCTNVITQTKSLNNKKRVVKTYGQWSQWQLKGAIFINKFLFYLGLYVISLSMLGWPIHALHIRGSILILASFPRVHMIYDFYDHWQIPISKACQVLFKSKGYFILYLKLNQTKHTYSITLKYSEVLITTASQACKKNYMYICISFSQYTKSSWMYEM